MTIETVAQNRKSPLELMAELDPTQICRLTNEILEMQTAGYEVKLANEEQIGCDLAYGQPDKIREIFRYLKTQSEAFASRQRQLTRGKIAHQALGRMWPPSRLVYERKLYQQLEPVRDDLLFGPDHTASKEWHDQHGRAMALLTIVAAHDLATDGGSDGKYSTMSGFLGGEFLDDPNLQPAMIDAEIKFNGKEEDVAIERVRNRIRQAREFIEAPVTPEFKKVVQYCTDSLGIRERKEMVNYLIHEYLTQQAAEGRNISGMTILSFGCGTALPIMEEMYRLNQEVAKVPRLVLLDQDPMALSAAQYLAKKLNVAEHIELYCERLFGKYGSPADVREILGNRQIDIYEDSGLREYLPDRIYEKLTKAIYQNMRPGGRMITSNMNSNRPQSEFLHGLMGWYPSVRMRSILENLRLHEKAGIKGTKAFVLPSGVYTTLVSEKPRD